MAQKKPEPKYLYRIGLKKGAPLHFITLGGQQFTRYSEKVTGYGSETERNKRRGSEVLMTEKQLKACKSAARRKWVRVTSGKKARSRIYDDKSPNFTLLEGDLSVSDMVYAEKIEARDSAYGDPSVDTFSDLEGKI